MALGLDPKRSVIWAQHDVPEVTELAWILACITAKGMMDKAHAFKDAVNKGREVNIGLYTYPILMAADILAFDSHVVPVGKDQKQHVEMARDMAQRFNHLFGETLVIPAPQIRDDVATVPCLDGQKMSKSYNNTIEIFLPPKKLRKKIMGIVTDSKGVDEPKDPDTCHVFSLYKLFATLNNRPTSLHSIVQEDWDMGTPSRRYSRSLMASLPRLASDTITSWRIRTRSDRCSQKVPSVHELRRERPWIAYDPLRACEPLAADFRADSAHQMGRNCAESALSHSRRNTSDTNLGLRENPDHRDTRDRKKSRADNAQPVTATRNRCPAKTY